MGDQNQGAPLPELTDDQRRRLTECNSDAMRRLRLTRSELLRELRDAGWSLPELARLYGCSKQRISKLLQHRADAQPPGYPRGEGGG